MDKVKINRKQLIQLLVEKRCIKCYGDSRLDIEFNKESLEITFHIICKNCNSFYIIKRPCNSEEELISFSVQIAQSTINDKGLVKVIGLNHQI